MDNWDCIWSTISLERLKKDVIPDAERDINNPLEDTDRLINSWFFYISKERSF